MTTRVTRVVRIVALDGGLRTTGLVSGAVWFEGGALRGEVDFADAFLSLPSDKVQRTAQASDDIRRSRELARWTGGHLDNIRPDVVAAEDLSLPRHAHAAKCCALGWGVFAAELERRELALVCAMPMQWRRYLVRGGKEAPARAEALRRCPTAVRALSRVQHDLQEHVLDANGVFVWSWSTDLVRGMAR